MDKWQNNDLEFCQICQAKDFGAVFVVTRADKFAIGTERRQRPATYAVCRSCGAMVLADTPDYENIYRDGSYYRAEGNPEEFLAARFEKIINLPPAKSDNCQRVKRIKEFLVSMAGESETVAKNIKNVLDIGAGMGVFLRQWLKEMFAWQATAVEPDPGAVAHLQKVLPAAEIFSGYLTAVPVERKFDLVVFNRVLEHIFSPAEVLNEAGQRLKTGGILYLEVPDVRSYYEDGPDNEAFGYGHFAVYSPLALIRLAQKANLEVLALNRVVEPSGKFTLYGFFRVLSAGAPAINSRL